MEKNNFEKMSMIFSLSNFADASIAMLPLHFKLNISPGDAAGVATSILFVIYCTGELRTGRTQRANNDNDYCQTNNAVK